MSNVGLTAPEMDLWRRATELMEAWLGEAMFVEPQAIHFAEVVHIITGALERPWSRGSTATVLQRLLDYLTLSRREWYSNIADEDLSAKLLKDEP